MMFVFYALAAVLIWLSVKSFIGGTRYLRYFKQELAKPPSKFTPFVSVIVPCRGLDDGLAENLLAVAQQDYPEFELIFVVDNPNDASVAVIEEVSRKDKDGAEKKLIVAEKAIDSGQKVANLREAVLHISHRSQVFAFADSDARPSKNWLRHLVARLEDKNVGVTTGYRWFVSRRPRFASEMRSVWNASIASSLGPRSDFCWAGAMAIRRETFERLDIREKWRGTLSDDFVVAHVMHDAGVSIRFVPQALTASIENCTLSEMFEFTNRQMQLTRVYAPSLWLMSFVGAGLFNVVMFAAFFIVLLTQNSIAVWISLATLAIIVLCSVGKAWLRLDAVRLVLPQYESQLRRQLLPQTTLWLLSPALFFYNSIVALFSRRMTWRGITYELKSPRETVIITD